ncbi:hypothetical protein NFI96_023039, partial [Prochilodus magdalenae]
GVLSSRISGAEVELEIRVRPGDEVTLYCDCVWEVGFKLLWFRNCSHQHQPPLIISATAQDQHARLYDGMQRPLARYSFVWNSSSSTHDLQVKNVSESDLGLYYCALREKKVTEDETGVVVRKDVYRYGNRTTRLSLLGVWFSRISGADVEMRVRPGDDVVLYSDCVWRFGFDTVWFRNSSHEHMVLLDGSHPRYSIRLNDCHQTTKLLVRNVSESDLGLYFCALQKKRSSGDKARACSWEDVCYYGNRTTRLSFHVKTGSLSSCGLDETPQTPPPPPVSDCSVCWKLLVSVGPVCVLLSSVVSATCVYWIYSSRTKARLTAMLWAIFGNGNVPLMWTNQISAQTSASKTLAFISPPAPVSEMERSRVALIALMCVLISSISGVIVEMRVKPGDNATIYCDCTQRTGSKIAWSMKPSHEYKPPLINFVAKMHPHHSLVWNSSTNTVDLLVENITESDLGLYYCALHEIKITRDRNGETVQDVYHEGNRTTFLSFLGESVHSDLLVLQIWVSFQRLTAMLWALTENRNVPLTWTNQISAQTSASKTLSITSPPAPVSEMERLRVALITLMCVLISSISGIVVEMTVKPGDNATIYCDCAERNGSKIAWSMKPYHEHKSPLINFMVKMHPHHSLVWNSSTNTVDLLVENITKSDLGLYYCALRETKKSENECGGALLEDVYHEGNRTTFLSFLDTTSTPPVPDCSVCWKLLVSVCPVCVLLSSVVSSTCVYCIYRRRTKGTLSPAVGDGGGDGGLGGGSDVVYAPLDILSSGQRRLKKRTVESSDLCTYSETSVPSSPSKLKVVPLFLVSTMGTGRQCLPKITFTTDSGFCVLISSISGIVVEMRVKPGDNVTIYCDCTRQHRFKIAWLRNCSHGQQPPLIMSEDLMRNAPPRYSFVWNISNTTYDLLVRNVSESDLGLYYCALHVNNFTETEKGATCSGDVYHDGNRTTFLSFLDPIVRYANPRQAPSTPSVSDCSVCWKLLVSVCPPLLHLCVLYLQIHY